MIEELRSAPLMTMHLEVAFDRVQDAGDTPTGRRRVFPRKKSPLRPVQLRTRLPKLVPARAILQSAAGHAAAT